MLQVCGLDVPVGTSLKHLAEALQEQVLGKRDREQSSCMSSIKAPTPAPTSYGTWVAGGQLIQPMREELGSWIRPSCHAGPEEVRWTKVKEERGKPQLDPETGGGTVDVTSTFRAPHLRLYTHPGQDCVPILNVAPDEV